MNDKYKLLEHPDYSDRRNLAFAIAKNIVLLAHRLLARPHVELDENIVRMRRQEGVVFLYAGLHKSLWETSGALVPLYHAGLPVPYVGMGDNLVHGRFFQGLSRRIGTFLIKRPANRKELIESARKLRGDILGFVAHGLDVMVFPEGTRKSVPDRERYGDFFPAAFEPLLEYEREKQRIHKANPALKPLAAYIVPFNVDYSYVRETQELLRDEAGRPRTLHVFDSLSMIRNIGDTYLSYGKPIRVADRLAFDRKSLAAECRDRCMELVKVLPINVVSLSLLRLASASTFSKPLLAEAIRRCLNDLRPVADRFRGFSPDDPPEEIIQRARRGPLRFDRFVAENVSLYRLYAAYIRHYLQSGIS
jgi:1-acyl-sn-glycerol-3-phosphate acyltransferase